MEAMICITFSILAMLGFFYYAMYLEYKIDNMKKDFRETLDCFYYGDDLTEDWVREFYQSLLDDIKKEYE